MNRYDYLEGYQKPSLRILVASHEMSIDNEELLKTMTNVIMRDRGANSWMIDPIFFIAGSKMKMVHFYYDSNLS